MPVGRMCRLSLVADLCSWSYMKAWHCHHRTGNGCSSGRRCPVPAMTRCILGARPPAMEEESFKQHMSLAGKSAS